MPILNCEVGNTIGFIFFSILKKNVNKEKKNRIAERKKNKYWRFFGVVETWRKKKQKSSLNCGRVIVVFCVALHHPEQKSANDT